MKQKSILLTILFSTTVSINGPIDPDRPYFDSHNERMKVLHHHNENLNKKPIEMPVGYPYNQFIDGPATYKRSFQSSLNDTDASLLLEQSNTIAKSTIGLDDPLRLLNFYAEDNVVLPEARRRLAEQMEWDFKETSNSTVERRSNQQRASETQPQGGYMFYSGAFIKTKNVFQEADCNQKTKGNGQKEEHSKNEEQSLSSNQQQTQHSAKPLNTSSGGQSFQNYNSHIDLMNDNVYKNERSKKDLCKKRNEGKSNKEEVKKEAKSPEWLKNIRKQIYETSLSVIGTILRYLAGN